jgi:tRNA dimethylallyltransferase
MPIGAWQCRPAEASSCRFGSILLMPPRDALYAACDARFLAMMEKGALAEVERLLARRLSPDLPAMKAVGVPELAACLAGSIDKDTAVAAAQQATRRYAKRQYTWFRRQMPEGEALRKRVMEAQFSASLLPETFAFIRQFLLTNGN